MTAPKRREQPTDPYLAALEELIAQSSGNPALYGSVQQTPADQARHLPNCTDPDTRKCANPARNRAPGGFATQVSGDLLRETAHLADSPPRQCANCGAGLDGKQTAYCTRRCKNAATKRRSRAAARTTP